MQTSLHIVVLFCLIFVFPGCVTDTPKPSGYSITAQSSIQLAAYFKYWPEMSGYYLPAGIYKAEREDSNGVFFKAPDGMKLLSLTGSTGVEGGIYLPKLGVSGVRGHVYLHMPLMGWVSYVLPDKFFSNYCSTWGVMRTNQQPNQSPEPSAVGASGSAARSTSPVGGGSGHGR